jgi:hypothetical protein
MSSSPERALTLLADRYAIARLTPDAPVPAWAFPARAALASVTRTAEELSIVCRESDVPHDAAPVERGWRALRLAGPIPFETVGVVAGLAAPLAAAGVPVFVLSTYDTDVLLVREADLGRARAALGGARRILDEANSTAARD